MNPRAAKLVTARLGLALGLAAAGAVSIPAQAAGPGKVVLVMGAKSPNPPHDQAGALRAVANDLKGVRGLGPVVLANWPRSFRGASTVVLFCEGGVMHPLTDLGRLRALAEHVDGGGGLVVLHSGLVLEGSAGERLRSWLGASFDPAQSRLPRVAWPATFTSFPDHPTTRGLSPFTLDEEWFLDLVVAKAAPGKLVPVLSAIPSEPAVAGGPLQAQLLAWAFERPDGGRSFGFSGGHDRVTWERPEVSRLIVNAIAWSAGLDRPAPAPTATASK